MDNEAKLNRKEQFAQAYWDIMQAVHNITGENVPKFTNLNDLITHIKNSK